MNKKELKETLDKIVFEIAYSNRRTMIDTIKEFAGEEYESTSDVFELAKLNKGALRNTLKGIYDYYFNELEELQNSKIEEVSSRIDFPNSLC